MSYEFGSHFSVLRNEIFSNIRKNCSKEKPIFGADLTFGGGGHVFPLLEEFENLKVLGTDQDPDAYNTALKKIKENGFEDRLFLKHTNFVNFADTFKDLSNDLKFGKLSFITLDLGVSSHQFDQAERGFSFREDGPLDMRMNYCDGDTLTAADIVNNYEEEELADLIYKYGEERLSRKIARRIVEKRKECLFKTTKDLEEVVFLAYPPHQRHKKPHPATRTFQALRIEVNKELQVISDVLPQLFPLLEDNGILQVISFHSLEDRIVKWSFKDAAKEDHTLKILTKKPVLPTQDEILNNPRSRSAKLRVIQKI